MESVYIQCGGISISGFRHAIQCAGPLGCALKFLRHGGFAGIAQVLRRYRAGIAQVSRRYRAGIVQVSCRYCAGIENPPGNVTWKTIEDGFIPRPPPAADRGRWRSSTCARRPPGCRVARGCRNLALRPCRGDSALPGDAGRLDGLRCQFLAQLVARGESAGVHLPLHRARSFFSVATSLEGPGLGWESRASFFMPELDTGKLPAFEWCTRFTAPVTWL